MRFYVKISTLEERADPGMVRMDEIHGIFMVDEMKLLFMAMENQKNDEVDLEVELISDLTEINKERKIKNNSKRKTSTLKP
jgi:hypothetical protein